MRIAMVFDGLGFGGIERVGVNYARLLVDMGHEVTIVNLRPKSTDMESEFPPCCDILHASMPLAALPDYFLPVVKKWWWGKYLYSPVYFASKLILSSFRLLHPARQSFDVAIAFSGHIRDLTYVAYDFINSNKQLAWAHGSLADYLLTSYSFANLYLKIHNLCVLSEQYQTQAIHSDKRLADGLQVFQLYNPIETEVLNSDSNLVADLRNHYGEFLLMVGRFDVDKDQSTVLRAQKVLSEKYDISPHVVFVGDGPTREQCENLSKALDLEDSTTFAGSRYDVDSFYQAATVVVHSSPSEGLPTVLLEAMRCGTPIVSTNSLPGVPEILNGDEYGLSCRVGDADDMAEKLAQLLQDKTLQRHYSEKGHERLQLFSFAQARRQLEKILDNLV